MLMKLPSKIPLILPGSGGTDVKKLWKDFQDILELMNVADPFSEIIDDLEEKTKLWIDDFLSLGSKFTGYQKQYITPYMHILTKHVPSQMRIFKGIKRFSGQPVEKNNDDARRNFHSSNKFDGPKEVILADTRVEFLEYCERETRQYNKTSDWWTSVAFMKAVPMLPTNGQERKWVWSKRNTVYRKSANRSGCPFNKPTGLETLRDCLSLGGIQDVEELVSTGKELGACPYYAIHYDQIGCIPSV